MKIQTSVRVEDVFYNEAKEVFQRFGLSFGDAVNIFLAKVAMEKGIPFDLKIPNATTLQAMKEAKNNEGESVSFEEFLKESKPNAEAI